MAKLTLPPALIARFGALPGATYVPDVLAPGLDVVFCGTALGYQSAKARAYYAHPGNFFWRTLYATGLTPRLLKPEEYEQARAYGIGLTDLCKTAYGNDTDLPAQAFDVMGLKDKIVQHAPHFLAFTSKTAAGAFLGKPTSAFGYGLQPTGFEKTQLYVLPSPSGQARIFWDAALWQALADRVRARP